MSRSKSAPLSRIVLVVAGAILVLAALPLVIGGVQLAMLGGSWYYILAGLALAVSGVLLALRRPAAIVLFVATAAATIFWSLWEVGLDYWPLMPRLAPFAVMGLIAALLTPLVVPRWRNAAFGVAGLIVVIMAAGIYGAFVPHGVVAPSGPVAERQQQADAGPSRWQYYGRDPDGLRFAPENQITQANVGELEVAWEYRTGDVATPGSEYQVTPIQIEDTVYLCTPLNKIIALDADTGTERWTFDPQVPNAMIWNRCRGVGYYESSVVPEGEACAARVVVNTLDGRLIQVDAETGAPCAMFGQGGTVDLTRGMGENPPGFYQPTSMPTVAGGVIVLGGWVFDNFSTENPSGVVRAFDAETGELTWAWDVGRPDGSLPAEGEGFSRATPNSWSTPAVDLELGLIYLPTGNHSPDFWGGLRPEASERVSSAVVALDLATGQERWVFQTVHHDLWDLDVASQPALYDLPDGNGGTTPALVQATKRGQIFVLDRRTGEPIYDVEERPVPQEHQEGDWVAPTQPYSTEVASIGADPLTEQRMWGLTFYDQLACRIMFRSMRYEGEFTAPTTEQSLIYPGYYGGMNWGSVSIDKGNDMLFVNDIRLPRGARLVSQEELAEVASSGHGAGIQTQEGAPYGIDHVNVDSPLALPCIAPPWGTLSGIDLKTGDLVWQKPAGTVQDMYLFGIKVGLEVPMGAPTLGGGVSTGSGLVFFAGTQDYYLRALNSATGEELWRGRLPVGAQATPMTYVSPETGRQYVVIVAGGARQSPDRADHVIAFALPSN